jgi:hypothetical protein
MKKLIIAVFTVIMTMAPAQKSEAAVAGIMAATGAGAAGSVAIAGLASPFVMGTVMAVANAEDDVHFTLGFVLGAYLGALGGLVLLDEETGEVQFNQIDKAAANRLALSMKDVAIYNSEIEEANILFEEVRSELTAESTVEESRELWNDMRDFVSPETFAVMQKLVEKK